MRKMWNRTCNEDMIFGRVEVPWRGYAAVECDDSCTRLKVLSVERSASSVVQGVALLISVLENVGCVEAAQ